MVATYAVLGRLRAFVQLFVSPLNIWGPVEYTVRCGMQSCGVLRSCKRLFVGCSDPQVTHT